MSSEQQGTQEVQVTIVATVTVPVYAGGGWLTEDAITSAAQAAREGRAYFDTRLVEETGAPRYPVYPNRGAPLGRVE
jgi:hypothetical protein